MNTKLASILKTVAGNTDVKISELQHTMLRSIAAMGQKPTIRINAAMDEATYEGGIDKVSNDYQLIINKALFHDASEYAHSTNTYTTKTTHTMVDPAENITLEADVKGSGESTVFNDPTERSSASTSWVEYASHSLASSGNNITLSIQMKRGNMNSPYFVGYSINAGSIVTIYTGSELDYVTKTASLGALSSGTVIHFWYKTSWTEVFTRNTKVLSHGTGFVGYTKNSVTVGDVVLIGSHEPTSYSTKTLAISDLIAGDIIRFWIKSEKGSSYIDECKIIGTVKTGAIKSNTVLSDANLIRYFEKVKLNLSKGTSTHATPLQLKIFGSADSYAAPLNSNWITIPENEYDELLLERKIIKTATSNTQTTWDFTSLTDADALINQIGCQYVFLVEQANDGSTYTVLEENIDYFVDVTNRKSPRITLASGADIVDATSILRATMIVDVLDIDASTKNTGIKVQIKENYISSSETSPSVQPLPVATTQYISVDYVARY